MKHNLTKGRMDDFFILRMGKTPPRDNSDYWLNGTNNWVAISDMGKSKYISSTSECITDKGIADCNMVPVPANTVVMSFKLSIGKTAITSKPIFTNEAIMSFLPKTEFADNILVDYIYYYLLGHRWGGTGKKAVMGVTLNKASLSATPFSFPSLADQKQAIAELDKINETIEDCRELLRNLDALAQSLFYDFFGDPITNPKGWPIDKLGNLLIIERGGSPRPIKEYITQDEDGINWIKIGDANSSMYISSTKEKIKPSGKSKSRFVKPGDFILSNSMSFGRPYIMNTYGCIHDGWLLLRDNNNFFNKIYLYYCLNSKSIYSEFERLVRTGTVSNLNSDIVRGVKIPVPPLAHQEKFAERIEQIEAQKEAVESTIAELQTLLDSRMDYWFN